MHKLGKKIITICLIYIFSYVPAKAELLLDEVWGELSGGLEKAGYIVSGEKSSVGRDIVINDLSIIRDFPEMDFRLNLDVGKITLKKNSDDVVFVHFPEEVFWRLSPSDGSVEVVLAQSSTNPSMTVSGDLDNLSYDLTFDLLDLILQPFNDGAEIVGPDQVQLAAKLRDVRFNSRNIKKELTEKIGSTSIKNIAISIFLAPDDEDFSLTGKTNIRNLSFGNTFSAPPGMLLKDFNGALDRGASNSNIFGFSEGQTEVSFSSSDGDLDFQSSSDGHSITSSVSGDGLDAVWETKNLEFDVSGSILPLPVPVQFFLGNLSYKLSMPMIPSNENQEFVFNFGLKDVSVSDAVWDMFDPTETLAREPATFVVELSGLAHLFSGVIDIGLGETDSIGEVYSLDINSILVKALSTQMTAEGNFVFDNSDFETFDGFPRPEGQVRANFKGVNQLLENISALGLIGPDEIMGARMFMGMFAVPVGMDEMETIIELDANGAVFANGQQFR